MGMINGIGGLGVGAAAGVDAALRNYFLMRDGNRQDKKNKRDEMLMQMQMDALRQAQAKEEAFRQGIGEINIANNPEAGVTPAVPQQGMPRSNQSLLNQYMPELSSQPPFDPMVASQSNRTIPGMMAQVNPNVMYAQTEQPFVAAQPAMVDEKVRTALKEGIIPQGGNYPTSEQILPLLMKKDPEKAMTLGVSLAKQDESITAQKEHWKELLSQKAEQFQQSDETKRYLGELIRSSKGNGQENKNRVFGTNLRKEFNNLPEIKESNLIMPKINNMEKAFKEAQATDNFVAVDQALITLYNKLTDPSSVVRESEYARTPENLTLINRLQGKISKIETGGAGLTMADRQALLTMARSMKKGYQEIRGGRVKEYRSYANDAGLDAEKTIRDSYEMEESPVNNNKRFVIKQVR